MSSNPFITSYDKNDTVNGNMVKITDGSLALFNKCGNIRRETSALTRVSMGIASINAWTELDGYFTQTPVVTLSPKVIPTYLSNKYLGTQKFNLTYQIASTGVTGKYKIKPVLTRRALAVSYASSDVDIWDQTSHGVFYFTDFCVLGKWRPAVGSLNVNFAFDYLCGGQNTIMGTNIGYYSNVAHNIFLDVASNYAPGAVASASYTQSNSRSEINRSGTLSYSGPSTTYLWRLRYERRSDGWVNSTPSPYNIGDYVDWFKQTGWSYSCAEAAETLSDSNFKVFYLAVGR